MCLFTLPSRPAEGMYQNLRCCLPEGAPESVHFCDIPAAEAAQVSKPRPSSHGFIACKRAASGGPSAALPDPLPPAHPLPPPPPTLLARPTPQAGDAQIQTSVERMQRVIDLGRAIRERHNRSVKMPVREVTVVHPDAGFLADLTGE